MLALPSISGAECIDVLELLGYLPHRRGLSRDGARDEGRDEGRDYGLARLTRGSSVILVPENATLNPALLAAILRSANVDPFDFLRARELAAAGLRKDTSSPSVT